MNEQRPPFGIEWTRLPRPGGTFTKGYSWNPLSGCLHGLPVDDAGWAGGGVLRQDRG